MRPERLKYGDDGIKGIKDFLKKNRNEVYTLAIYDLIEENTLEIKCKYDEIVEVIEKIITIEHDYPEWIGINELSESYVIGMNFTRGMFHPPAIYEYKDGNLKEIIRL